MTWEHLLYDLRQMRGEMYGLEISVLIPDFTLLRYGEIRDQLGNVQPLGCWSSQ